VLEEHQQSSAGSSIYLEVEVQLKISISLDDCWPTRPIVYVQQSFRNTGQFSRLRK
jgi:hypothetical protein